ncbi:serine/threonine protein kinase Ppk15 [Mucor mucedo]|uniref:serine/threonine protein kinase Ppk15 n=1 Tax=Mucor mucedo TaxID=29922 RepID=UPI00222072CD|nr:serine/threonine protein kinase Ppk15 [Mucor mucedo]KAI7888967.1 serine/threonine protein kinase Ppk15 [Mucor mucedo]
MTVDICDTFKKRNPRFRYDSASNPKRVLTKPSAPSKNDGFDNENSDYILYVHGFLGKDGEKKYQILDVLGSGTFGQVAKCKNVDTGELVGVKVIKNKPAYTKQSLIEVEILTHLNTVSDPDDQHNILRLKESFFNKNHLCLVFELLSVNLYELIKQNHFKGLSTNLVRVFSIQLLDTLSVIKASQIIHCDLKPENILLKNLDSPAIKVIDFGSACHESQQTYTYIQSRFYRSPEVLLGLRYTTAIDMWSFGCIVAELYLGLPIFPGSSEYNQVTRITEAVGNIPDYMIISGKYGHRYFNRKRVDNEEGEFHYFLKDIKQYSEERKKAEKPSKRYFSTFNLDELVLKYPMPRSKEMTSIEEEKEMKIRHHLLDFLKKVLQIDPLKRLTPQEASRHPFISGVEKENIEQEDEMITLGKEIKKKLSSEDVEEDVPSMLTGESRSSTSVSPYSRKRYGSILSPLLSPPIEKSQEKEQFSQLSTSEPRLRQRHR